MLIHSWRARCSALESQRKLRIQPPLLNVITSFNNQLVASIHYLLTLCQALFEVSFKLFNAYKATFHHPFLNTPATRLVFLLLTLLYFVYSQKWQPTCSC